MNNSTNKMDTNLTGMWVSFFTAAGLPSDVSATYALTFAENRIQNDMLLDLNKEYLRDMGIIRMGDVIAILRHAKQVHESAARDKVLGSAAVGNKVPVAAVTGRATTAQPSSPASRMLERYTRNPASPETAPAAGVKLKRKSSSDVGNTADTNIKKSRVIRFESPTRAAPTAPAAAAAAKDSAGGKHTVFSRLGGADAARAPSPPPAAKRIYLRLGCKGDGRPPPPDPPLPKDALEYEGILKAGPPARRAPALAERVFTVTAAGTDRRRIAVATMRADEAPVGVKQKLALPRAKSVKFSSRVQYKEIESVARAVPPARPARLARTAPAPAPHKSTPVFNKPERRLCMPTGGASGIGGAGGSGAAGGSGGAGGVKARLGAGATKNFTITRNVFNRLGA